MKTNSHFFFFKKLIKLLGGGGRWTDDLVSPSVLLHVQFKDLPRYMVYSVNEKSFSDLIDRISKLISYEHPFQLFH